MKLKKRLILSLLRWSDHLLKIKPSISNSALLTGTVEPNQDNRTKKLFLNLPAIEKEEPVKNRSLD
jgi:hypothetical protein